MVERLSRCPEFSNLFGGGNVGYTLWAYENEVLLFIFSVEVKGIELGTFFQQKLRNNHGSQIFDAIGLKEATLISKYLGTDCIVAFSIEAYRKLVWLVQNQRVGMGKLI